MEHGKNFKQLNKMEVLGKIKVLNPIVEVGATFKKQELVVATEEQYPQFISINFVQDKCDLLNNYKVGDNVKVSINLRGREWVNPQGETKYFNDIQGWRIEKLGELANVDSAFNPPATLGASNESDGLPF